jgi:hypothetical protein
VTHAHAPAAATGCIKAVVEPTSDAGLQGDACFRQPAGFAQRMIPSLVQTFIRTDTQVPETVSF